MLMPPEKIEMAMPPDKVKTVIPTGASRRFFFSFAPAKEAAREVEESLFDLRVNPSPSFPNRSARKKKNANRRPCLQLLPNPSLSRLKITLNIFPQYIRLKIHRI